MARAISSGLPARLSGTPAIKPAFLSAPPVNRFSISVSTGPGATALTRTPNSAPSRAAAFVNPSTACLLAVYMEAPGAPLWPMVDDRLMMLPRGGLPEVQEGWQAPGCNAAPACPALAPAAAAGKLNAELKSDFRCYPNNGQAATASAGPFCAKERTRSRGKALARRSGALPLPQ